MTTKIDHKSHKENKFNDGKKYMHNSMIYQTYNLQVLIQDKNYINSF